jgi:hypothetical protein
MIFSGGAAFRRSDCRFGESDEVVMIASEATHLASFPRTQPRVCGAFLFRFAGLFYSDRPVTFVPSGRTRGARVQPNVDMGQKQTSRSVC